MHPQLTPKSPDPLSWGDVFRKSIRLRCPHCGRGEVCQGWFQLYDSCAVCGYDYRREPGFYLGSIYFNYGLTALVLTLVCTPLVFYAEVSTWALTVIAVIFCVAFPTWFLRYARSLWLGFDYFWDRTRSRVPPKQDRSNAQSPRTPEETDPSETWRSGTNEFLAGQDEEPVSERLLGACPFCHEELRFEPQAKGTWDNCPQCGQSVLLMPRSDIEFPDGRP